MTDYGSDLSCISDCSPEMLEVTGRLCLAQAIARRYITPRGRLIDDPNYGYDLTQYLNDDLSPADMARIQAGAEAEAEKDERIVSSTVVINVSAAGVMVVTSTLVDATGPFTLVLAITEVNTQILSVSK